MVAVFLAVALANAAIGFAYSKDVILSPAGAFYALALSIAVRRVLLQSSAASGLRVGILAVALTVVSGAWAFRAVHLYSALRVAAETTRNEWAYADSWIEGQRWTLSPDEKALKLKLQYDAIARHPAPSPLPSGVIELFEE